MSKSILTFSKNEPYLEDFFGNMLPNMFSV